MPPRHLAASNTSMSGRIMAGRAVSQPVHASETDAVSSHACRYPSCGTHGNPNHYFRCFPWIPIVLPIYKPLPLATRLLPLRVPTPPSFPLAYCCIDEINEKRNSITGTTPYAIPDSASNEIEKSQSSAPSPTGWAAESLSQSNVSCAEAALPLHSSSRRCKRLCSSWSRKRCPSRIYNGKPEDRR